MEPEIIMLVSSVAVTTLTVFYLGLLALVERLRIAINANRADPRIIDARGTKWPIEIPRACFLAMPGDTIQLRDKWQVEFARICLDHLDVHGVKTEVAT